MDAEKFGAFISQCRKEKQMTQAELAARLQVTDKAVSRWERGVGFPDISTIEPLADALDISVVELMKSEKSVATELSKEEAAQAVSDTLTLAKASRDRNGNISAPSSESWLSSYCYSCGWITCNGNWIPSSSQGSA